MYCKNDKINDSNELVKMFLPFPQEPFFFVRHSPLLCFDLVFEVAKFKDVKNKALSKRL